MFNRFGPDGNAAKHSGNLRHFGFIVQSRHFHPGFPLAGALCHSHVIVTQSRDLRQMGHAQDLPLFAQCPQHAADDFGGATADAHVDLIEHQGGNGLSGRGDDLDGEADA